MESNNAVSVSILNNYLKKIIDSEEILINIKVYGEITDVSLSKNIVYFSLKDESALISCVCFSSSFFNIIKNGAQVVLTGNPKFWVKGGKLSFQVSKVEDFGKGKAYLEFIALKEKLEKLGMFNVEHKKQIPKFSKTIGVVSSSTGAVIKDICNVAQRRNRFVNIVLFPSQVQGIGASQTLIEGLNFLDNYGVDVIIIARGGGSVEDLSAFNDERLAFAIYNAKTPIVSAVGHETDFSICDFVADLRAPTPSAAAELLTIDVHAKVDVLTDSFNRLFLGFSKKIINISDNLNLHKQKIKENFMSKIEKKNFELISFKDSILFKIDKLFKEHKNKADVCSSKFEKLNPLDVLKRGFSKVSQNGKVVEFSKLKINDNIDVEFYNGVIGATIKSKKEKVK